MDNPKNILIDTLYVTLSVIDRTRLQHPDFYTHHEFHLEHLNRRIREMLDLIDMTDDVQRNKAG